MSQSGNFTGSSVPLIESLKSKVYLITDARKGKNLTHLQRVLLFKDSRGPGRMDSMSLSRKLVRDRIGKSSEERQIFPPVWLRSSLPLRVHPPSPSPPDSSACRRSPRRYRR